MNRRRKNKLVTAVLYLVVLLVMFLIQVQIRGNEGEVHFGQAALSVTSFLVLLYGLNYVWIKIREVLFCDEILEEHRRTIIKVILFIAAIGTIFAIIRMITTTFYVRFGSMSSIWQAIALIVGFFVVVLFYHPYISVVKYRFWVVLLTTFLIGYSQANFGAPYLVSYFISVGLALFLAELQSENKIASSIVLHILVWILMIVGSVVLYYLLRDGNLSVLAERFLTWISSRPRIQNEGDISALRTIVSEANWYEAIDNPGTARASRNYLAYSGNFMARILFTSGWFAVVLYILLLAMFIGVLIVMFLKIRKESITYYISVGIGIYIIVSIVGGTLYDLGILPLRITPLFVHELNYFYKSRIIVNTFILAIPLAEFWTQGYKKSILNKINVPDKKLASFISGYMGIFLFAAMLFLVVTGKEYSRVFNPIYNVEKTIELIYDKDNENVTQIQADGKKTKDYDEISIEDLQNRYSNLILVKKDEKYGYVDAFSGQELIKPQYKEAYSFSKYGIAPVLTDENEKKWSWIDENGQEKYSYSNVEEIVVLNEEQYLIKIDGFYGILEYWGELNMFDEGKVDHLELSPDKKYLYSADEKSTKVWIQTEDEGVIYYNYETIDCPILELNGELFTFYDEKEKVTIARLLEEGEYQVLSLGQYTEVLLYEDTGHQNSYYAAIDNKYGMIGYDEKLHVIYTILKVDYQEAPIIVEENQELMIVKQKDKYGCISFQNQQVLEVKYNSEDEVIEQLKKDNKIQEEQTEKIETVTVMQYIA